MWALYNMADRVLLYLVRTAKHSLPASVKMFVDDISQSEFRACARHISSCGSVLSPSRHLIPSVCAHTLIQGCIANTYAEAVCAPRFRCDAGSSGPTSGLVQDVVHVILPRITPMVTAVLTGASMLPALAHLWRCPHWKVFLSTLIYCSHCSFMLGWHVHEKAVLLTLLPVSLTCLDSYLHAKLYLFFSPIAHFSLFPLLHQSTETPVKVRAACITCSLRHASEAWACYLSCMSVRC